MFNKLSLILFCFFICSCSSNKERTPSSTDTIGHNELSQNNPLVESIVFLLPIRTNTMKILNNSPEAIYESLCTGTVISNHFIITAAHCLSGVNLNTKLEFGNLKNIIVVPNKASVSLDDIKGSEIILGKEASKLHESYDFTNTVGRDSFEGNDIAIIHVEDGLEKYGAKPIKLYSGKISAIVNKYKKIEIAGYGELNPKDGIFQLNKDSMKFGFKNFLKSDSIKGEITLKQEKKNGFVEGDSGGPSYIMLNGEAVQIGINSAALKKDGRSTSIAHYKKWIEDKIKEFGRRTEDLVWINSI